MPDFTQALARGLDARRRVFFGPDATLVLYAHAFGDRRGTDVLLAVISGWHFEEQDEGFPELQIAEMLPVTEEVLLKAASGAFAINRKEYKVDQNTFTKPFYPNKRVWKFTVKPTGQTYP